MLRKLRIVLIAVFTLGLAATSAEANSDLVEGSVINSEAGYDFTMAEIGKLKLTAVKVNGQRSDKCRVSVNAVKGQITQGMQSRSLKLKPGMGQGIIIYVYLDPRLQDQYVVCDTPGSNCEVQVEIPDPPASLKTLL